PRRGAAEDDPAALAEGADRLLQGRRTDMLEHDVDAAARGLPDRLAEPAAVEGLLRAELQRPLPLGLAAARREHPGSEVAADRDPGTEDLLARPARVALPAADDGIEDDLVARVPAGVGGLGHDAGPVRGQHARRLDALGAARGPEVEVVQRRRAERHRDLAGLRPGPGTLLDAHAGRAGGFLEDGGKPLAPD